MAQQHPVQDPTILDPQMAQRLADVFAVLADPVRLRILAALSHHELSVNDLAERVGMSQPATSHHLRLLRAQRIVRARKEGRQVFYALDDQHIHDLLDRGITHIEHE